MERKSGLTLKDLYNKNNYICIMKSIKEKIMAATKKADSTKKKSSEKFKAHPMYKGGKTVMAFTMKKHKELLAKGYSHKK